MNVGKPVFSFKEVERILGEAGYQRGTMKFANEVGRRFMPDDTGSGGYVERDDWVPVDQSAVAGGRIDVC